MVAQAFLSERAPARPPANPQADERADRADNSTDHGIGPETLPPEVPEETGQEPRENELRDSNAAFSRRKRGKRGGSSSGGGGGGDSRFSTTLSFALGAGVASFIFCFFAIQLAWNQAYRKSLVERENMGELLFAVVAELRLASRAESYILPALTNLIHQQPVLQGIVLCSPCLALGRAETAWLETVTDGVRRVQFRSDASQAAAATTTASSSTSPPWREGLLWVRPDTQGRKMAFLLSLPEPGQTFVKTSWQSLGPGVGVFLLFSLLGTRLAGRPARIPARIPARGPAKGPGGGPDHPKGPSTQERHEVET